MPTDGDPDPPRDGDPEEATADAGPGTGPGRLPENPLGELAERIRADGDTRDHRLAALESALGGAGPAPEASWDRLRHGLDLDDAGPPRSPSGRPRHPPDRTAGVVPEHFPVDVLVAHGVVTAVLIGLAGLVYAGATVGVIARPLWLFSIPILILAIAELLPVAAWFLGGWDPQRI